MSITRRLFLRNSAVLPLGAAALPTVTAQAEPSTPTLEPLVYADDRVNMWEVDYPKPSPRAQAIWHIRELERLTKATGAEFVSISVVGHRYGGEDGHQNCKLIGLMQGKISDHDNIFAEGGAK